MDRESLIQSAGQIPEAGAAAVSALDELQDEVVVDVNRRMSIRTDIQTLVGETNLDMMRDNHGNHVRFLLSIMKYPNPVALTETCLWVFRTYRSRGFHINYWSVFFQTMTDVLQEHLPAFAYEEIEPMYNWLTTNIPTFEKISRDQMTQTAEPGEQY
jgi:hypothetical protein